MSKLNKIVRAIYVRNFIFGVEDSLVSTVGLVSGIAVADVPTATIFLSGMILIVVEALSMGVGSVLSETSTQEFVYRRKGSTSPSTYFGGLIMFASYFLAGFIPLFPYAVLPVSKALPISVIASLISLLLLGSISAVIYKVPILKNAVRMLVLGGLAISAGALVGSFLS